MRDEIGVSGTCRVVYSNGALKEPGFDLSPLEIYFTDDGLNEVRWSNFLKRCLTIRGCEETRIRKAFTPSGSFEAFDGSLVGTYPREEDISEVCLDLTLYRVSPCHSELAPPGSDWVLSVEMADVPDLVCWTALYAVPLVAFAEFKGTVVLDREFESSGDYRFKTVAVYFDHISKTISQMFGRDRQLKLFLADKEQITPEAFFAK